MCNFSYWCENCNVPLIMKRCGLCGQGSRTRHFTLKPVFEKEHSILDLELKKLNNAFSLPSPVFRSRNYIIYNGANLFSFHNNGDFEIVNISSPHLLENATHENFNEFKKRLIKANKEVLVKNEKEAMGFIKRVFKENKDKIPLISFSGGKDSAITAYLVSKALKKEKIPLLFSNTTIEFPETIKFVKNFAKKYGFKLIKKRANRDFREMCNELGPPSRMMRWCCSTQKAAPLMEFYRKINKQILSFDGIRKYESLAREKYKRIHKNTKLTKQLSVYPIFNWSDFNVWAYVLFRGLKLNPLYDWGYSRVGCWGCPSNGKYDEFLIKKSHPEIDKQWKNVLIRYADKNDKTLDWVYDGKWKSRLVKYKYFEECTTKQLCSRGNSFIFKTKSEVTPQLFEYLKVFGNLEVHKFSGKEHMMIKGDAVTITAFIGSSRILVNFEEDIENIGTTKRYLIKQLEKAFNCVHCGACVSACHQGAIEVNGTFHIKGDKCKHCLICCTSKFIKQSCAAIHYSRNRKVVYA